MENFLSFFLVLFAGVFFSTIFRRFNVPWVVTLIVGGVIIGPYGFDLFEVDATMDFIGQIGLIFLMFMAGLETNLSSFRLFRHNAITIAVVNGSIPFLAGVGIGYLFGYDLIPSLFIGTIFISSSVAAVIPSLDERGILHTYVGKSIISSTIIMDVISLIILSLLLQSVDPSISLPLPLFYAILFGTLIVLRKMLPKIQWFFTSGVKHQKDLFQHELRSIFLILIGTVISFELIGLHPIIAGFFAGLVLSDSIESELIIEKLRTISYGLFIPTFFVVVGAQVNIELLTHTSKTLSLVIFVVFGSMITKFVSGWFGARLVRFNKWQSALVGASTIPQLSTTLAVAFSGATLGILDEPIVTAMVVLSVVSTFVAPILIRIFSSGYSKKAPSA